MFYCAPCQIKNDWPISFSMSRGPCEECGKVAVCFDVHHSQIPKKEDKPSDSYPD